MDYGADIILQDPAGVVIESDFHTLIIKDYPEERHIVEDENGNPIENIYEIIPGFKKYKLFLQDFMDETAHGWNRIIAMLQEASPADYLEIHISSSGGNLREGMELYHIIRNKFEVSTAYLNYGYSMGAFAFLFAKERIVYEHSQIMFHSYSHVVGGKRNEIMAQVEHNDKFINKFIKDIVKPYFSKKEIKKMENGKDFWFNSKEMLKRGIATGILIDGEYISREDFLKQ